MKISVTQEDINNGVPASEPETPRGGEKMPTLDELAEELCEMEASEAEACGHKGFPGWCDSDTARREHFRQRVRDIEVRRKTAGNVSMLGV